MERAEAQGNIRVGRSIVKTKRKAEEEEKKDFHSNREIKLIKAWVNATSNEGNKITRTLKW